ncbi:MAG: hypothetical protein QM578_23125 [Pantoea sp.]|uniref:hypothetical protein n=1 Tax=Pantoea sp. TaxID=69393 RepID=UPI0039E64720
MIISLEKSNALQRMLKGAKYLLRGDKAIGLEVRRDDKTRKLKEVNCRSLAPLLRDGLVEFAYLPTDITRYYEVRLTEAGERLVRELT